MYVLLVSDLKFRVHPLALLFWYWGILCVLIQCELCVCSFTADCENLLKKFLVLNPTKRASLEVRKPSCVTL